MAKKKVFISFDFDNDRFLKEALIGQSKLNHSPFEISDWSLKEEAPQKLWEEKALFKIKRSDIMVVLLGDKTYKASGVLKEIMMAKNNYKRIIQLKPQRTNPIRIENAGVLYDWTWENLQYLLR